VLTQSKLRAWARNNASILSVTGALIIFFSWAVTNTISQRYSQMKQSLETAQGTFRLYTTLHGRRDQLNSVALEVVQGKTSNNASRLASGRTGDPLVDDVRIDFDLTRLSAHQIKELMDFTVETDA
jgi:hypothetical protein